MMNSSDMLKLIRTEGLILRDFVIAYDNNDKDQLLAVYHRAVEAIEETKKGLSLVSEPVEDESWKDCIDNTYAHIMDLEEKRLDYDPHEVED